MAIYELYYDKGKTHDDVTQPRVRISNAWPNGWRMK